MDMSMIDLTDLPDVKVGDEVEIFGRRQRVDDLAAILNTIPYELTCAVSKRVPRVYIEGGKIVEGCSIHLDGNGDRLRHKNTLLFGHSTILFSNNQG